MNAPSPALRAPSPVGRERAGVRVGSWDGIFGLMGMLLGVAGATVLAAAATRPPYFPALELGVERLASGELLLGELNCTGCHEASPAVLARLQPKPGPTLGQVSGRLRPDFVRAWLLDPLGATPGTTMPDVLRRLSGRDREVAVEELIHYLWSLAPNRPPAAATFGSLQIQQGRMLYHQTGCVACHTPIESPATVFGVAGVWPSDPEAARSLLDRLGRTSQPLPDLAAKYVPAGLMGFLRNPLDTRPGGRMPSLRLTDAEARAIAGYLLASNRPPLSPTQASPGFVVRPELARRGRDRFALLGCAGCHELGGGLSRIQSGQVAPPLDALDPDAGSGCLAGLPSGLAARYALSESQRAALKAALPHSTPVGRERAAAERVLQALARFNCLACHSRDGHGGPNSSRADYFSSLSDFDLGDEGRLPPHLNAVGNKLRPSWLGEVLTNTGAVRPYMAVRMPQFGPANVASLAVELIEADATPTARDPAPSGDARAGAELVGLPGYSCVTCHSFGPHASLGISVMDLTQMSRRLNWDWFRRYLLDPASLRPGTRMPAFWPDAVATVTSILDGDTTRQIASIWAYLTLGVDAPPPPGLIESLSRDRRGAAGRGE